VRPKVYIETTIPSFYYSTRKDPKHLARQQWTRKWWDNHRFESDLYSSFIVLDELEAGSHPYKQEKVHLLDEEVKLFRQTSGIEEITEAYWKHLLMPRKNRRISSCFCGLPQMRYITHLELRSSR
jgi:hypothetical protein